MIKCLPAIRETRVQSLGWEDTLEKEMATHSSTLAWKIPWMEKPGGIQSMGLQWVGHDWATSLCFHNWLKTHTAYWQPSIHSFLPIFLNNQTLNLSKVCASSFPDSQWSGSPYDQVLTKEMKNEFIGYNSQALFLEITSAGTLLGSLTFNLPFLSYLPAICT